MSQAADEHRAAAPAALNLALLTVSDTRTAADDASGDLAAELAAEAGHEVVERRIVPDEPSVIRALLLHFADRPEVHAVLLTGGTGVSTRDQTYETVSALLTKPLPGYGELLRTLSYAQVGSACILSRAVGGLIGRLAVLTMPGSRAAVELAMTKIILPELPHLVREARKH